MSVYSTKFYFGEAPVGSTLVYTVPGTQTVVLRDLEVYNSTGAELQFVLYVAPAGSGGLPSICINSVGAGEGGQWQGRVVLDPGDGIYLVVAHSGTYVHLSGYLLD